jgi:beta-lactamase regulating signal transducer with metallopeptidase domain
MNPLDWLDASMSLSLVQTLLHFLWQAGAIAVVALALEQLLAPGAAQARYLVHLAALLAMAACLPVTWARMAAPHSRGDVLAGGEPLRIDRERVHDPTDPNSGQWPVAEPADDVGHASSVDDLPLPRSDAPQAPGVPDAVSADEPTMGTVAAAGVAPRGDRPRRPTLLARAAPYAATAYLASVLGMFVRLAHGIRGGRRLRKAAEPVREPALLAMIARQAKRVGLRVAPVIAYCEQVSVPVVVGIMRPMILLPGSLVSDLTPGQLEALITHELAHLRRYDPLVNLLQRLVEAVGFFHPAVWLISRRMDVEREHASDDMVLVAGCRRVQYADALVRMAELSALLRARQGTPRAAVLAADGGGRSDFQRRVLRLLEGEPSSIRLTHAGFASLVAILVMAVLAPLTVSSWAQQAGTAADPDQPASHVPDRPRLGQRIDNFRLQDSHWTTLPPATRSWSPSWEPSARWQNSTARGWQAWRTSTGRVAWRLSGSIPTSRIRRPNWGILRGVTASPSRC